MGRSSRAPWARGALISPGCVAQVAAPATLDSRPDPAPGKSHWGFAMQPSAAAGSDRQDLRSEAIRHRLEGRSRVRMNRMVCFGSQYD
jgi:hypothetical protein